MNEIPTWWLVLTGLFCVVSLIAACAMAYLLLQLLAIVKELKPKLSEVGNRVEAIALKVDNIATKVDSMATTAKASVEIVGTKAQGLAAGAEALGILTSRKASSLSQYAMVGTLLYKLVLGFLERRKHAAKQED